MSVQTVGGNFTIHVLSATTRIQTVGGDFTIHVTQPGGAVQQVTTVGDEFTIHVISAEAVSITDQTVEPFSAVTVQAITAGIDPASYTWSSTGPAVTLIPGGPTCTFEAPAAATQQTVTVTVTARFPDGVTFQDSAAITVLPATEFVLKAGTWVPLPLSALG